MTDYKKKIQIYQTAEGENPFIKWLDNLNDISARAKIRLGIDHLGLGRFGDCMSPENLRDLNQKLEALADCVSLGDGLHKMILEFGPRYRLYFGQIGDLCVLLCGGIYKTQKIDVRTARDYWNDFRRQAGE